MNKPLYEFLATWYHWALTQDADVGRINDFTPRFGLCTNYFRYQVIHAEQLVCTAPLTEILDYYFRDSMYPFGVAAYKREYKRASHHKNPARLAWVKSILEEYADEFSNKD